MLKNRLQIAEEAGRADGALRQDALYPLAALQDWQQALHTARIDDRQDARMIYLLSWLAGARREDVPSWQSLVRKAKRAEEVLRASHSWVEVLTTSETPIHILEIALKRQADAEAHAAKLARQLVLEWHRVLLASEALSA